MSSLTPLKGNPEKIKKEAAALVAVAGEMKQAAQRLAKLTSYAAYSSGAMAAATKDATKVKSSLETAAERYQAAGNALGGWAAALQKAKADAAASIADHSSNDVAGAKSAVTSAENDVRASGLSDAELADAKSRLAQAQDHLSSLQSKQAQAEQNYNQARADRDKAAESAAATIVASNKATNDSPLDRIRKWVGDAAKVLKDVIDLIALAVLAVVVIAALVILTVATGGTAAILAGIVMAAALKALVGLGVAAVILAVGKAWGGTGSWKMTVIEIAFAIPALGKAAKFGYKAYKGVRAGTSILGPAGPNSIRRGLNIRQGKGVTVDVLTEPGKKGQITKYTNRLIVEGRHEALVESSKSVISVTDEVVEQYSPPCVPATTVSLGGGR